MAKYRELINLSFHAKLNMFWYRRCDFIKVLRTILTVIFVIICITLTVLVLMQEGKSQGLGSISGMADTYWGKNKGRSMEGALVKITTGLAVGFMVLAVVPEPPNF